MQINNLLRPAFHRGGLGSMRDQFLSGFYGENGYGQVSPRILRFYDVFIIQKTLHTSMLLLLLLLLTEGKKIEAKRLSHKHVLSDISAHCIKM